MLNSYKIDIPGDWFGCEFQRDDIILSVFFFLACIYIWSICLSPFLPSIHLTIHSSHHPSICSAILLTLCYIGFILQQAFFMCWNIFLGKCMWVLNFWCLRNTFLSMSVLSELFWPYLHNLPALDQPLFLEE